MPSSPLLICFLSILFATAEAQYALVTDYFDGNFFDKFSFWNGSDPTHGFVIYQPRDVANGWLISNEADNARILVDNNHTSPNGRASVRLTSLEAYQFALIIIDIGHMPGGICGTWPAFWTVGPDWPNQGEIDIVEGVNDQRTNDMTLHTGPGCSISKSSVPFSGIIGNNDCTSGTGHDQGCQILTNNTQTYGSGFNELGGGVYAMEWTQSAVSIFFFSRGTEPPDLDSGLPNPNIWGEPLARFQGDCNMAKSFSNQNIVFDTTFCGDWAGEVWPGSACAASTQQTCEDFVASNPAEFTEAYWSINALKVYQMNNISSDPSGTSQPYGSNGTGQSTTTTGSASQRISSSSPLARPGTATQQTGAMSADQYGQSSTMHSRPIATEHPTYRYSWKVPVWKTHG